MQKTILLSCVTLLFLTLSTDLDSQDAVKPLEFEVAKVFSSLSITRDELNNAECLGDLNRYYDASWVREYKSVQINFSHNGESKKIFGKNEVLTPSILHSMKYAEPGSEISVLIDYIPNNSLKINDIKQINFSFYVEPEYDALFKGDLNKYIKTQAIEQIPESSFVNYDMAAIKFTIDKKGNVINEELFQSSNDENIDKLLLSTISQMPAWIPARYEDGTPANQEYALIVGNKENCMINLLNLKK